MKNYCESALLTDLYELTMLQAYHLRGMNESASFEFFVRRLPEHRNFLMAAGLPQVIEYLSGLCFTEDDIAWIRASGRFAPAFIDSLHDFRFTGDVDALPEGTVFFHDEPVLRITAPLREAQFVESRVMNLLHYQSMVASKAARCVLAAPGKLLVDFGLRRAHGAEAAVLSARASYLAGFDGTATTVAARSFGIPVFGTMAHSYIQAHEYETDAFAAFAQAFPENTTLLIDTYDTEAAAQQVVRLAHWLREEGGIRIKAVRLDSGDLGALAWRVRKILDLGGCPDVGIFASGNLDEYALQALVNGAAPIDAFGVGTRMNTSEDAPFLDCAYKLVEYAGKPSRKRSTAKATWPGRKQVFRRHDGHGLIASDTLALHEEELPGRPLLQPVMRGGVLVHPLPPMSEARAYARAELAALPQELRRIEPAMPLQPHVSPALGTLAANVDKVRRARAAEEQARWAFEPE
jgi:nicotinate phosphoribosyltransferase